MTERRPGASPASSYEPPPEWPRVTTIDAHTAGEPLRVITSGVPEPPGQTILEKRRWAQQNLEPLRRALMLEPRGHADMYGCLLTEPVTEDGDVGVLFLHNEGYSTMCGHGIIGLVKVGLDCGLLAIRDPADPVVRIDTPAGRVTARPALGADGRVESVSFLNVPSFVLENRVEVEVARIGAVPATIAFGGAFYAYVEAEPLGLTLSPDHYRTLIDAGMAIKRATMDQVELTHPSGDQDLSFLYGTILVGPPLGNAHSRNVCVFADGEVDRSPTGTGVSGRAAIHFSRGELALGESITIESLIGSSFEVRVADATTVGGLEAIVPEVTGSAWITGRHEFLLDPRDPLLEGIFLR